MRAAGLDYERRRLAEFAVADPPAPAEGEALFRVHEVGICGTDRALAAFEIGFPPAGESRLVLGHEALGEVLESRDSGLERGDWVVPLVRRSCSPPCASCARGRRDLCLSGNALERGIFGLNGYLTSYAVEPAADLVRVPSELADVAVLLEPLSVVEKAVETALRLHQGKPRRALALGAGPIGLLAALVLQLRGLDAAVYSLEPPDHPRARLARDAGLRWAPAPQSADIAIEAAGSAEAAFAAVRALAPLGVCAILGGPNAAGDFPFLEMLVKNQVVFGSINAGPEHFAAAVRDLARLDRNILNRMLRRARFDAFAESVIGTGTAVKTVLLAPGC